MTEKMGNESKNVNTITSKTDEEKKERRKIQHREYMARRRKEDPEFAQKQRDLCNARKKILREDPEYVKKERADSKIYHLKYKQEFLEMKNILKTLNLG